MSIGTTRFVFKRGDTFCITVRWRPKQGGLQNLLGANITSHIKDYKSSYFDLDCTLAEDGMSFVVIGQADKMDFLSTGLAQWDARIEINGTVIHTPTIVFSVTSEVTKSNNTDL